ncbi:hypothetical protein B0H34DRAFT_466024 [Crassisporium funariophilum]|nr:hypothetical protein B0H34DRAFT_466024 [Crassisporium funariophilum]
MIRLDIRLNDGPYPELKQYILCCRPNLLSVLRQSNSGWRFATGSLMVIFRGIWVFVYTLCESPKFLMGKGRDDYALDVIPKVAAYNRTTSSLVIGELREVREGEKRSETAEISMGVGTAVGAVQMHLQSLGVDTSHAKSLFETRTRVYSTSLLIILWGIHGFRRVRCMKIPCRSSRKGGNCNWRKVS